jgi:hypothetical protein
MRNVIILTHLGMGDMISISPAIRYFARNYDEVYIISKQRYFENCMKLYEDVDNVNILSLRPESNDSEYRENLEINQFLNNFDEDYDLFTCGIYNKNRTPFNTLPDNFYIDLGLNLDVYENYFYLPKNIYQNQQFKTIIGKCEYLFICGTTSLADYTNKIISKIDSNLLLLCPSKNLYGEEHEYYDIAETVVDLPIFDYVPLIQNAKEIHVIASSFSILSKFVSCKNTKKYLHNYNDCGLSTNFFKEWQIIHN